MLSQTIDRLEVHITGPDQRDELLNDAEATLRQISIAQRCSGILVTRHSPRLYTLAISETVPFGETWEHTLS